jgi:hypothetical protein
VAGDLAGGEVVEDRVNHLGRGAAQRSGAPGEVGVPGVAQAERQESVVRLVGEVGDQVDRLDELVQAAGGFGGRGDVGLDLVPPLPQRRLPVEVRALVAEETRA